MQIYVDVHGYIQSYSIFGGTLEGAIEADDSLLEQIDNEKMGCYQYIDGQAVLDTAKYEAQVAEKKTAEDLQNLLSRRESECFSVVNRGRVWYDQWSEEQYQQIKVWYEAWLDVTESGAIPEKPDFLT